MEEKLELTQEWDKVFPLSEKVNHKKVTFETQYGLTLAADLYTPASPDPSKRRGVPIIINSGYRSPQLNKKIGGVPTSNHLTGCAVDIRVENMEQLIRYAAILLDISNETHQDFDELLIEKRSASPLGSSKNRHGAIWLHFAVRPSNNRRKVSLIQA